MNQERLDDYYGDYEQWGGDLKPRVKRVKKESIYLEDRQDYKPQRNPEHRYR